MTAAATSAKIEITVTEQITTTYVLTTDWLRAHDLPEGIAGLSDHIANDSATTPYDPVDDLALKLSADENIEISEHSVLERDLYLGLAQ